jgi:hypothetical protein
MGMTMTMTMTLSGTLRLARMTALAVAFAMVVHAPAFAQKASAQRKAADAALQAGLAAQKARKHPVAVGHFSKAIAVGGLPRKQMNYALYRRAISFRAAKRPAQAISDLNSALYFTGDLSATDRAAAIKERAKAFKDAGLEPTVVATATPHPTAVGPGAGAVPAAGEGATAAASGGTKKVQPRRSLSSVPQTTPILGGSQTPVAGPRAQTAALSAPRSSVPAFTTRVRAAPQNQRPSATHAAAPLVSSKWKVASKPAAGAQPLGRGAVSSWSQPTVVKSNPPQPRTTTRQTAPPATPEFGNVSKFFGSIFESSPPAKVAPRPLVADNVTTATSYVTPGRAYTAAPKRGGPRQYDISVAAIRSKWRADALAKTLMARYSSSLSWSGKKARVDRLPATAKRGELYAVKLGSYGSKGELATQCEKLIADGFDCQVIRRN